MNFLPYPLIEQLSKSLSDHPEYSDPPQRRSALSYVHTSLNDKKLGRAIHSIQQRINSLTTWLISEKLLGTTSSSCVESTFEYLQSNPCLADNTKKDLKKLLEIYELVRYRGTHTTLATCEHTLIENIEQHFEYLKECLEQEESELVTFIPAVHEPIESYIQTLRPGPVPQPASTQADTELDDCINSFNGGMFFTAEQANRNHIISSTSDTTIIRPVAMRPAVARPMLDSKKRAGDERNCSAKRNHDEAFDSSAETDTETCSEAMETRPIKFHKF